jgi:hypothetical protein
MSVDMFTSGHSVKLLQIKQSNCHLERSLETPRQFQDG